MSTTSVNTVALRPSLAAPNTPSTMTIGFRLAWKEFRQLTPLALGIAAMQIFVIVLLSLLNATLRQDFPVDPSFLVNIALVSPTLMAIAMVGISIAQERQNGNWTWCSSLPITWLQSLMAKVIVWLVGSVVISLLVLAVAAMAINLRQESIGEAFGAPHQSWTHLMAIVIALHVFLYFATATLLLRDSLLAMVLAGIYVAIFHCLVVLVAISTVHSAQDAGYLSDEAFALGAYAISFLVGVLALLNAYRWRWGAGNYSSLIQYDVPQVPPSAVSQSLWAGFATRTRQPSETWMLLSHGIHAAIFPANRLIDWITTRHRCFLQFRSKRRWSNLHLDDCKLHSGREHFFGRSGLRAISILLGSRCRLVQVSDSTFVAAILSCSRDHCCLSLYRARQRVANGFPALHSIFSYRRVCRNRIQRADCFSHYCASCNAGLGDDHWSSR